MSGEREFLECEIADAMESDEDSRLEVALIIRARSQRDEALALLAQREGEIAKLRKQIDGDGATQESTGPHIHIWNCQGCDATGHKCDLEEPRIAPHGREIEALRGKVGDAVAGSAWAVCPFCGFLNCPYDRKPSADDHKESCPWRPVFAALSDSQEGRE